MLMILNPLFQNHHPVQILPKFLAMLLEDIHPHRLDNQGIMPHTVALNPAVPNLANP
jgi:hypothetical protein